MIYAKEIVKTFNHGAVKVLGGLSLTVPDGKHVAILGASGSGKTTALNVLSGLERPDSGEVLYDGKNIYAGTDKELTAFRRETIGFIFQKYYLMPHLSVENNVRLGADLVGNKQYKDVLAAVGLADKAHRKPSELSGGEQQRVCIARALAKNPKVLFLDEPTGALDEETGRGVLDYILRLKQALNFTMIMVTHNAHIAETADEVIMLASGRVTDTHANPSPKDAYSIGW